MLAFALLGAACKAGSHAPSSVSTGPGGGTAGGASGDAGDPQLRSQRPDGGPRLPPADKELILPFRARPAKERIEIAAAPGVLDVHFSIDTTGSIGEEIDALQSDLARTIVPQLDGRVQSVSFGVSRFADFPASPFGASAADIGRADRPFVLLTPVTSDRAAVASAVAQLDQPLDDGGDVPEAGAEALWQIATGKGYSAAGRQLIAPFNGQAAVGGGSLGGVGFRSGALRVVLHVTDAPSHVPSDYGTTFPGTHGPDAAASALHEIGAKLVAIVSGACDPNQPKLSCDPDLHQQARAQLEAIALATGGVGPKPSSGTCPTGIAGKPLPAAGGQCPLVFDVNAAGEGVSTSLVDAIVALLDGTRFQVVSGDIADDPIGFVKSITPVQVDQSEHGATPPALADLQPMGKPDGRPDSFVEVPAHANLAFDVELQNDRIAGTDVDQVFRVRVEISGDGVVLEQRTLRLRVPAADALVPLEDAGLP